MKTTTLPSVRVRPEFRAEVKALLNESETLSEFVETSVRESVRRRRNQQEFVRRGLASLENAKQTNGYVEAEALIVRLERRLTVAKAAQTVRQL